MIKPLLITSLSFGTLLSGNVEETMPSRIMPASETCEIPHMAFQAGESLTYKVYYNWGTVWLSGGEVYFKLTKEDYKALYKFYEANPNSLLLKNKFTV